MAHLSFSFVSISFSAVWRWKQLPSKRSMRMGGKWIAQQVRLSSRIRRRRLWMCWAWSILSICKFNFNICALNESNNQYSKAGKCVRCARYMCLRRGCRKVSLQVREALRRRRYRVSFGAGVFAEWRLHAEFFVRWWRLRLSRGIRARHIWFVRLRSTACSIPKWNSEYFFFAAAYRAASVTEHIVPKMPCVNGTTSRVFRFACARKVMSAMAFNNASACRHRVMFRIIVVSMLNACWKHLPIATNAPASRATVATASIVCQTRHAWISRRCAIGMENAYRHQLDINANAALVSKMWILLLRPSKLSFCRILFLCAQDSSATDHIVRSRFVKEPDFCYWAKAWPPSKYRSVADLASQSPWPV